MNVILSKVNEFKVKYLQKSFWADSKEINEGDFVLYIGYPMLKELDIHNYPISRIGIISQKIEGENHFLIDGFVQHGHSGSPVFLIKEDENNIPPKWDIKLIGITTSYPSEYANVLEEVKYKETTQKVILNPGFTVVTSMDVIIPEIIKLMNKEK